MDQPTHSPFTLGEWAVDPILGTLTRDGETTRIEPRMMRLLVSLADRAGEVVSADDLLDRVWPNVIVTPDSVYQAVAALRRLLGDNSKDPRYIVTVPRQGYRMVARVTAAAPIPSAPTAVPDAIAASAAREKTAASPKWVWLGVICVVLIAVAALVAVRRSSDVASSQSASAPSPNPRSIAVLPFLDLTEAMGEEIFADGMTEELIDKIAKIPGVRVPPPTASFWLKDKDLTIAEIARKLDVAYVVDGSVRKSDTTMRVAARLVRASDGFVVWSETYDRPSDDKLMIQDDIATAVGNALENTIVDRPTVAGASSPKAQ